MGEQHANGWRVSRHRLVADATVGIMETLKVSVDTSTRPTPSAPRLRSDCGVTQCFGPALPKRAHRHRPCTPQSQSQ